MKILRIASTSLAVLALGTSLALAQQPPRQEEHRDEQHQPPQQREQRPVEPQRNEHPEWRKGSRMRQDDWQRGERVDYREHHLRAPPRGYEWREVDGRFILGAIATGVIADIILNAR
jgi:Ni/Co efflux regulator RcnB